MSGDSPTLGEVIRRFGADLLRRRGASLTPAQHAVLVTLGRCRTPALGGHLYRCNVCGAEGPGYNSCGDRHCPSCLGHKRAEWLRERQAELLPVPYFHVVFTVPEEIAALALGNKKVVYSILFRAASETLLQLAQDPRYLGATLGFLAILHTWTQTLLHHPHIHCIVPAGGLSPDRSQWVSTRENFLLPIPVVAQLYRGKFLVYLTEARLAGELRFAGVTAPLADSTAFLAFLREQRRKDWVVYVKPPFGSPEQVLKYLARYTHRVAISDSRILAIQDDTVSFRYRDRKDHNRQDVMTLTGVELLRRFLLHVLPDAFVRIRYFGLLANCVRADNLAHCRKLLAPAEPPSPAPSTPPTPEPTDDDWQRCPRCGIGVLCVVRPLDPAPLCGPGAWLPVRRDTS